jgi:hypothetical protein
VREGCRHFNGATMYEIEFAVFDSLQVIKAGEVETLEQAEQLVEQLNAPTRGYQAALGLFRVATQ